MLVTGQHLAKLLGGGSDDGDEIGLAKPALDAVALQVTARPAMKHRRMRGCDARVAEPQTQRDDAPPIAVIGIIGIARQRHRFLLELGMELAELNRLLRQIAVDVAERRPTSSMIWMQSLIRPSAMPACSRMKPARIFLTKCAAVRPDQFIRHEHVAELHAIGARAVHGEEWLARLQGDRWIGAIGKEHDDAAILVLALEDGAEMWSGPRLETQGSAPLTM